MFKKCGRLVCLALAASACSVKVTVNSDAPVALRVKGNPAQSIVGQGITFTVTAVDSAGQPVIDYVGTVAVTSTDSHATLPSSYTFTTADAGTKTFNSDVILNTVGNQNVTVSDTADTTLTATFSVNVAEVPMHCAEYGTPLTATVGTGMTADAPIKDVQLDASDAPVVAYQASTGSLTYVYVQMWNGSAWSTYDGGSLAPVSTVVAPQVAPVVAIDAANRPMVAFAQGNTGTSTTTLYAYLVRWNGSAWTNLSTSNSGTGLSGPISTASNPSLAFVLDNLSSPWVAWDQDNPYEVSLATYNGSNWVSTGQGPVIAPSALHPALAMPSNASQPFIAWTDDSNTNDHVIYAAQYSGSAWGQLGGALSVNTGSADDASIAIASDGAPVVAWDAYDGAQVLNVYVMKYVGGTWVELAGSGSGRGISNNTTGGAQRPAIATQAQGGIYVAWEDVASHQIYLRFFDGVAWEDVGGSASGNGVSNTTHAATWPQIHVQTSGTPVVSWEENLGSSYVIHTCAWQ